MVSDVLFHVLRPHFPMCDVSAQDTGCFSFFVVFVSVPLPFLKSVQPWNLGHWNKHGSISFFQIHLVLLTTLRTNHMKAESLLRDKRVCPFHFFGFTFRFVFYLKTNVFHVPFCDCSIYIYSFQVLLKIVFHFLIQVPFSSICPVDLSVRVSFSGIDPLDLFQLFSIVSHVLFHVLHPHFPMRDVSAQDEVPFLLRCFYIYSASLS